VDPVTARTIAIGGRGDDALRLGALEWTGSGPLLILVHATSFCADVWKPAWRAARAKGPARRRALAIDQRGHGRSTAPTEPSAYAWTAVAEDVVGVLGAELGAAERALLVGHSSGGTVVLAAAAIRPDRVAAVAVVEPVLFEPPAPGADADSFAGSRLFVERARKRRARFEDRDAARAALRGRFPYSGFAAPALEAYLDGGFEATAGGELALRCTPEIEGWAYRGAAALDLWPLIPRVEAPVWVVAAEHSAMPPPLLERLRGCRAGVRVEQVPGTTHFAVMERPEQVGAILADFAANPGRCRMFNSSGSPRS
jgi:pimeloyl-ACP methyl ester carboxylesterase